MVVRFNLPPLNAECWTGMLDSFIPTEADEDGGVRRLQEWQVWYEVATYRCPDLFQHEELPECPGVLHSEDM